MLGDPGEFANRYYKDGIDEILFMDAVATLYGRSSLPAIVSEATKNIFVPITVGGGIRTLEDATAILRAGADKVAVNSAAVANPQFISDLSKQFGNQSVVLSIEAKKFGDGKWSVYTETGRERSNLEVISWAEKAQDLGAGEILLTSIDNEGTKNGFDLELITAVCDRVSIPVIASGGMGVPQDFVSAVTLGKADGVAVASCLHYKTHSIGSIKEFARISGMQVRENV